MYQVRTQKIIQMNRTSFFMEYMHFKKAFYFCARWLDTEIQLRATVDMFLFLAKIIVKT